MVLNQCNFFSKVLGICASMNILLPQKSGTGSKKKKEKLPVLYLLHGSSDDHSIWLRRTSIERYADVKDIAVVMPA